MPDEGKGGTFTNITQLVKALAWPVLILYVFLRFQGPLSETVDLLPDTLRHASKISAGGLTLEIEQKAQEKGNDIANALRGLSTEARKLLLQVGDSYWHKWGKDTHGDMVTYTASRTKALRELTQRKLMDYRPESHDTFDAWVRTLGPISTFESGGEPAERLTPSRPLSSDEEKRLQDQQFYLSPLGKKAYNVILEVVVNS